MHITFIQTGGTIDKDYPRGESNHGYYFAIRHPAVHSILRSCHVMTSHTVVEVTKKDSLDLTNTDRTAILKAVQQTAGDRIIVTHGTDTILKTAKVLDRVTGKVVVLTGAMLPEKMVNSDARFNIGMAVAAVQTLPHGIYIALYGRVVPWNEFKTISVEYEKHVKKLLTDGKDVDK